MTSMQQQAEKAIKTLRAMKGGRGGRLCPGTRFAVGPAGLFDRAKNVWRPPFAGNVVFSKARNYDNLRFSEPGPVRIYVAGSVG